MTRFKLVQAVWRRQRMDVLPGVAPVSLLLAQTEDTVVGLTDVRGYPNGFVFLPRVHWGLVADPDEQPSALIIERNVLEWRLDPASRHRIPEVQGHDQPIVILCPEGIHLQPGRRPP